MRIFVTLLIVLAALYFWDVNYNNGTLSDGVIRMERSMFHAAGDGRPSVGGLNEHHPETCDARSGRSA
jgi:hypothetical protein